MHSSRLQVVFYLLIFTLLFYYIIEFLITIAEVVIFYLARLLHCLTYLFCFFNEDFAEFRESAFWRPERIRSSTSVIHAISPYAVRMTCGVCQKLLKRKPHNFGSTLASEELSIAAVLVCGHIFHADCLEQRTQVEDKRDPPCPICSGFDPQIELIDLERDS